MPRLPQSSKTVLVFFLHCNPCIISLNLSTYATCFPLPASFEHLYSSFFASVYVSSIYLLKSSCGSFSKKVIHTTNGQARLKEQDARWKDDPDDIARAHLVVGIHVWCFAVIVIVGYFVGDVKNVS